MLRSCPITVVPGDVADDERRGALGRQQRVVPVAPDLVGRFRGEVTRGDLEVVRLGQLRQHRRLERPRHHPIVPGRLPKPLVGLTEPGRDRVLARVELGVVENGAGTQGDAGDQSDLVGSERRPAGVARDHQDAQDVAAGRERPHAVGRRIELAVRIAGLLGHEHRQAGGERAGLADHRLGRSARREREAASGQPHESFAGELVEHRLHRVAGVPPGDVGECAGSVGQRDERPVAQGGHHETGQPATRFRRVEGGRQRLGDRGEEVQPGVRQFLRGRDRAQCELTIRGVGQHPEHLGVGRRPLPYVVVGHAHRTDRLALGRHQRVTGPPSHAARGDRRVARRRRVRRHVGRDERLPTRDQVLADRLLDRQLARSVRADADAGLLARPAIIDDGDEGRRCREQLRGQCGDVVERGLRLGVEQAGRRDRGHPGRIANAGRDSTLHCVLGAWLHVARAAGRALNVARAAGRALNVARAADSTAGVSDSVHAHTLCRRLAPRGSQFGPAPVVGVGA
jgi:hypothetical protein